MAHIVIVGAGLGGLPTAYELRHILPKQHQVTVISETPYFSLTPCYLMQSQVNADGL
jgi:sulfide:quinone oxidoreductase